MDESSESYCVLIRILAKRNLLSSADLTYILGSTEPVNPVHVISVQCPPGQEMRGAGRAYEELERRGLDWNAIRGRLREVLPEIVRQEEWRERANVETELQYPAGGRPKRMKIGILWCTFFQRRSWFHLSLRLPEAYRPPSLFASIMRDNGHEVEFLLCDEYLDLAELDGTKRRLPDDVDLLYFLSHGELVASGFEALLYAVNWQPGGQAGFGNGRLAVAVFDTCHLIDTGKNKGAQSVWGGATLGSSLRLLLGFDGPANIDQDMAKRGKAFAENLTKGKTFADSWIQAVNSTSQSNKPVAIGIGDSSASASSVLNTARVASMPAARLAGPAVFFERF